MCGTDCFLMLLAVLFPPVAVWIKCGICSAESLINIALSILGFLPGLLHAWYIILKYPDPYDYEAMNNAERGDGSVTYYVVARGPAPGPGHAGHMNYGTVGSQPSAGQFPGQQSGTTNAFAQPKSKPGPRAAVQGPQQGAESSRPSDNPPTYADVIKGDHKVQKP